MTILLQGIVSGIGIGAIYAMLALSYTIIFSTLRMAHFAQGDIYMIGMLLGFTFYVTAKLPFVVALIVAVILTILIMLVIERLVYRPLFKSSSMYLFICTIGMATFLRSAAQLIFGSESFAFPPLFGNTPLVLGLDITILPQSLAIIVVCVVLVVALRLFMKRSKTGLAMSAVSMNRYSAVLMGVNFSRITMLTYGISAALATIAGVFTAPLYNVHTNVGANIGMKALVAAIMGGFGNTTGAIVGGVLLGLIEALGSMYISSAYKDAFAFIALIIILIVRPQGLFGRKSITKV